MRQEGPDVWSRRSLTDRGTSKALGSAEIGVFALRCGVVLVAGLDLAVTAVEPLADKEIFFGCWSGGGGLCGFEEALADVNCALGVCSAFVPGCRGIDRVQADGGRVDVLGPSGE